MKKCVVCSILVLFFLNFTVGCDSPLQPTASQITDLPSTPQGKTLTVTSAEDSGSGTLRQALLDSQTGDIITFDPGVFNPKSPVAIELKSGLPPISQGYLTVDASNAGVILDGSQVGGDWTPGIEIDSEHNIFRGLQVVHFTGAGISLTPSARFNVIGGDRLVGLGSNGQGNMIGDNSDGVAIKGSDNVITGNLIGTDITGSEQTGNRGVGIFLEENASRNIIGPNNIIAYNGTRDIGGGIEIRSINAKANTITANSIHDNTAPGIYYNISGGFPVEFPTIPDIYNFDLVSGTVGGITCPDCVVEIFSTSTTDGEIYEGAITADQNGNFSLGIGKSFSGPFLTATSRSSESNTSVFSAPTSGTRSVLIWQEGNESTWYKLESKTTSELEDNRIGHIISNFWAISLPYESWMENDIENLGAKRIRLSINEADSDQVDWSRPEFEIEPTYDDLISEIAAKGITMTYRLQFWDKAYHASGGQVTYPRFKTEDQIARYLDFVKFIVHHFKDRIHYYEIWNEPTHLPADIMTIDVADYLNLVRQAIPVIHQEDPEANIVVGSISGLSDPTIREYLFTILKSDIMPSVDVITWHPMFGTSPEFESDYYYNYPALVQSIKEIAFSHGFRGEYVAEELVYLSPDCTWCNPSDYPYSNISAAKYYARGIVMNLGLEVSVGVASNSFTRQESFTAIQNLCTLMAGAMPENFPFEIQSEATNIKSYGFSFTNDDKLLALWSDGIAVEDDPGIESEITIPDFAGWTVTAVDVLHGFEQQLITSDNDGNLVISGLLIKDYPIILRLSDIVSP